MESVRTFEALQSLIVPLYSSYHLSEQSRESPAISGRWRHQAGHHRLHRVPLPRRDVPCEHFPTAQRLGLSATRRGFPRVVHANEHILPDPRSNLRYHEPNHIFLWEQNRVPFQASRKCGGSLARSDHHPVHTPPLHALQAKRDVPCAVHCGPGRVHHGVRRQ